MFDRDGNGRVSAAEVGVILRGLDRNPSQQELKDIIRQVDKNGEQGRGAWAGYHGYS